MIARFRRWWYRVQDWLCHRCPLCLVEIARPLTYCGRCNDAVQDVRYTARLISNLTAEGREER